MNSSGASPASVWRLDAFEVDLRAGELRREGVRVPIQDLPLRLLGILAEQAGQVVTREVIQHRLWEGETFVDFEDGLNTAIRKLRQALQDDPRQPRLIETIRGYGYRLMVPAERLPAPAATVTIDRIDTLDAFHIGSVATLAPSDEATSAARSSSVTAHGSTPSRTSSFRTRTWLATLSVASFALAGLAFGAWWLTPVAPPSVERIMPITSSGRLDYCMRPATDGARLYFLERAGDHWNLMQTSMIGGESQPVAAPFRNTAIFDVSPDGSQLLAGKFDRKGDFMPVYSIPVQGGTPVRLGAMSAQAAAWSHSGNRIAAVLGDELWVANADGSNPQRIVKMPGDFDWPSWGPNDETLRFNRSDPITGNSAIWEVGADGGGLRQLLVGWSQVPSERYGSWSADGRYFVFTSDHDGHSNIWVLRERSDSWRRSPQGPFRLTAGPLDALGATMSPDDKRVYFCSQRDTFELNDFDPATQLASPFLPGLNPWMTAFSRDWQWVVYTNPSAQLLRSRADGSDHRLLENTALRVGFPRFSPDGQTIAFTGREEHKPAQVYTIGRDGGLPVVLTPDWLDVHDPDWSPDGRQIVVSHVDDADRSKNVDVLALVDVRTHATTSIRASENFFGPRWSPKGGFIAATGGSGHELNILNLATGEWHVAATGKAIGISVWSLDGSTVIYQDLLSPGEPLYRVHPQGGAPQQIAEFSTVLQKGINRAALMAIGPNGHPLMMLTRANSDLYAAEIR